MDGLVRLMGRLNIDEEFVRMDELMDQLRAFDISASRSDVERRDTTTDSMDDLCNRFEGVTLGDDGLYLQHVTGKTMFIPYGHCGLTHKISMGTMVPKWTIAY